MLDNTTTSYIAIMRLRPPTKLQRIGLVVAIASIFLVLEIVVGFLTRSLALVADAFHILSDLMGYVVAMLAIKVSKRPGKAQYTFGLRRTEILGAFFNGAFLAALGVSILLQSIERFVEPSDIKDPILVMAVGAAGIGSNVVMLLALGGHSHGGHSHGSHSRDDDVDGHHDAQEAEFRMHTPTVSTVDVAAISDLPSNSHARHAHARVSDGKLKPARFADLNILGVLVHILGDALNSVAVIISAGIYKATGFVYADPIASVFVGCMIIGTAWPILKRSSRNLMNAAPDAIDIEGVKEDIQRITGEATIHDLHVWSVDDKNVVATMHLLHASDSLKDYDHLSEEVRKCLHLWGIHSVTIQPETIIPTLTGEPAMTIQLASGELSTPASSRQMDSGAVSSGAPVATSLACRRLCTDGCLSSR